MSNQNELGRVIAELRKERGAKQEELASAVGVSTQAVSKWENGGYPDAELLPAIAGFFNVSIDRLYGRCVGDYGDIRAEVQKHIASFELKDRYNEAMEFCWAIEKGIFGDNQRFDTFKSVLDDRYTHSQIPTRDGISTMSLTSKLPYFYLLPRPEGGWDIDAIPRSDFTDVFAMLGDIDVLNAIIMFMARENKPFTAKLVETKLNIPADKVMQILVSLERYEMIRISEVELDDAVQKVYSFNDNPAVVALLAIATEIIRRPNCFRYNWGSAGAFFMK